MLFDPTRHEALQTLAWDEGACRAAIQAIVDDTERRFSPTSYWPLHPRDVETGDDPSVPVTSLYYGACGVMWALRYLQSVGAARLSRDPADALDTLLERSHAWLASIDSEDFASWLMGDTPILLLAQGRAPTAERAGRLAALIEGNLDHPSRELMWGAPGTMLAASFLHQHDADPRWADLFRRSALQLWSQLEWSDRHECAFWTQDLYGHRSTYLDAVHGFVATASVLIRGRQLLDAASWSAWAACITNTVLRTATREGALANWRVFLDVPEDSAPRLLMQFCHGAPGFVVCLADLPGPELDELLIAAGEATWAAGPLAKGSNLCHGTAGNGYAFLKLYRRSGDTRWLERARAFAMHALAQSQADAAAHGQGRYSLWTGDPGLAIYLWACVQASADYPTLDVFFT
jgi:hypothetical protein